MRLNQARVSLPLNGENSAISVTNHHVQYGKEKKIYVKNSLIKEAKKNYFVKPVRYQSNYEGPCLKS